MHFYVVGVNGSGKTTLLRHISEATGISLITGSTGLMESLGIAGDYDALRAMDQAYVLERWGRYAEQLIYDYSNRPFLLDTHILNLTNGQIIRRDGPWIRHYDALVLVKADTETVFSRIEQDGERDRALFPVAMNQTDKRELLHRYQHETEQLFHELANKYKQPALVIDNSGDVASSVQQFEQFYKLHTNV